ncbi:prolyl oligopeptidase family serine peptidase [Kitasatospora sp. NPDC054939]
MTPRPPAVLAPVTAAITARTSFRFSADGLRAACAATDGDGRHLAESWQLTPDGPRLDLRTGLDTDPAHTQLLPLDATGPLISWHGRAGAQTLARLTADGRTDPVPVTVPRPVRLLPAPAGPGWLALAVGSAGAAAGGSALYAVPAAGPRFEELARVPGTLLGGVVLGHRVLFTRLLDGTPQPLLADLRDGRTRGLPAVTDPAHVLAAAGGRVLLALHTADGVRMALADLDGDGPPRPVVGDTGLPGAVHPLALDPDGARIALLTTCGARSHLTLLDPESGTARHITAEPGELQPVGAWTAAGLWLPHADPRRPRTLGWLPPGRTELALPAPEAPAPERAPHRPAPAGPPVRLEDFPGADGPVEAVVYGPDWRSAPRVVLALHGGPNSRWTLGHEPVLQAQARAGAAVVALNQRGSTGYGAAHTLAIAGAWGGPDLADIVAVGRHLTRRRGPGLDRPALFGTSYGAYLALLAAAAEPEGWSACAAVAPFLSGARLHADGSAQVRSMVERLDGLTAIRDALGPRDVERLAPALRVPLLLVHGARDESVPVGHSRALVARLTSLGRRPGTDFHYLELPDRGHAALGTGTADPVAASVVRFLTGRGGDPAPTTDHPRHPGRR